MYNISPTAATDTVAASVLPALIPVYLEDSHLRGVSAETLESYRRELAHFLRFFLDGEPVLTRARLQGFIAWMKAHSPAITPGYLHTVCRRARQFLRWLHTSGRTPVDMSPWLPLPARPTARTNTVNGEEITRLFNACHGILRVRNLTLLAFLLETGTRRIEAANAQWQNITYGTGGFAGRVYLERVKNYMDTDKTRTVVFGPVTGRLLQLWQLMAGKEQGPIFALSNSGVQQVVDALASRAQVTVTAHDFRRTFATHWIRHCHAPNLDLAERLLEVQLGHAPQTVTQRHYLVLTPDHVAEYYVSPLDELALPGVTNWPGSTLAGKRDLRNYD